jgi:uncharacterized alkaline shock family protein YloU
MSNTENRTKGNLKISENVLATIAATAASETAGVAAMSPAPNLIGTLKATAPESGVVVKINADVASVDVYVKLNKGAKITEVSSKIQDNVKNSIQNMSKIVVEKVNVVVAGIVSEE